MLGVDGAFGITVDMISRYSSGWVDEVIMCIVAVKFSLPFILVALALIFGLSLPLPLRLLAFLIWGSFTRQVHGEEMVLSEMGCVTSVRKVPVPLPPVSCTATSCTAFHVRLGEFLRRGLLER